MQALTWDIVYSSNADAVYKLTPLGDIHLGARACKEAAFRHKVAEIEADPNHYWIGMGDMTDAIGRNGSDKRSDEEALASWLWGENRIFEKERDRLIEILTPIAPRCLGMLTGNHEQKVLQVFGQDMYYAVCGALQRAAGHNKVLALGYAGFVRLRFRRAYSGQRKGGLSSVPVTIYATHGFGGGRKAGGKANKFADLAGVADADLYLFGHVHAPEMALKERRMSLNQKGKIERRTYVGVITGTYLEGYDSGCITYSERFGFQEAAIGSPTVYIYPTVTDPEQMLKVKI